MVHSKLGTLHTDASLRVKERKAGVGGWLAVDGNVVCEFAIPVPFCDRINVLEYSALVCGMQFAAELGITGLDCTVDSQVVAHQINGVYACRSALLRPYLFDVYERAREFPDGFSIRQVPRARNEWADTLSGVATQRADALVKHSEALAQREWTSIPFIQSLSEELLVG